MKQPGHQQYQLDSRQRQMLVNQADSQSSLKNINKDMAHLNFVSE